MRQMVAQCILVCGALTGAQAATGPAPENRIVWRAPGPMTQSDWVWGSGGKDRAPAPPFQFVKENTGGTNPKVNVRDARGATWIVKFGAEVHPEVFASRLLYATGFDAEPTYFVESGVIAGVHDLRRAKPFIAKDGRFRNARFKLRDHKAQAHANQFQWSWVDNPFRGTHEMNGLRILAMLMSNWDTKDARDGEGSNTAVFLHRNDWGSVYWYAVSDWGATFGSWGGFLQRSRWDVVAYESQTKHFVKGVTEGTVQWGFEGKHGRDISEGIGVEDVRWMLPWLSRITHEQMVAGFLASGATRQTAERFSRALRDRVAQLEQIAGAPGWKRGTYP
jgi:hypothetical protein